MGDQAVTWSLQVFIDSLALTVIPGRTPSTQGASRPSIRPFVAVPAVVMRWADYPPVVIHPRADHLAAILKPLSNSPLVSASALAKHHEHASAMAITPQGSSRLSSVTQAVRESLKTARNGSGQATTSFVFESGKSALFHLNARSIASSVHPLYLMVVDALHTDKVRFVGSVTFDLGPALAAAGAGSSTQVPLRDVTGSVVGSMDLIVQLACLGTSLSQHIKTSPEHHARTSTNRGSIPDISLNAHSRPASRHDADVQSPPASPLSAPSSPSLQVNDDVSPVRVPDDIKRAMEVSPPVDLLAHDQTQTAASPVVQVDKDLDAQRQLLTQPPPLFFDADHDTDAQGEPQSQPSSGLQSSQEMASSIPSTLPPPVTESQLPPPSPSTTVSRTGRGSESSRPALPTTLTAPAPSLQPGGLLHQLMGELARLTAQPLPAIPSVPRVSLPSSGTAMGSRSPHPPRSRQSPLPDRSPSPSPSPSPSGGGSSSSQTDWSPPARSTLVSDAQAQHTTRVAASPRPPANPQPPQRLVQRSPQPNSRPAKQQQQQQKKVEERRVQPAKAEPKPKRRRPLIVRTTRAHRLMAEANKAKLSPPVNQSMRSSSNHHNSSSNRSSSLSPPLHQPVSSPHSGTPSPVEARGSSSVVEHAVASDPPSISPVDQEPPSVASPASPSPLQANSATLSTPPEELQPFSPDTTASRVSSRLTATPSPSPSPDPTGSGDSSSSPAVNISGFDDTSILEDSPVGSLESGSPSSLEEVPTAGTTQSSIYSSSSGEIVIIN